MYLGVNVAEDAFRSKKTKEIKSGKYCSLGFQSNVLFTCKTMLDITLSILLVQLYCLICSTVVRVDCQKLFINRGINRCMLVE